MPLQYPIIEPFLGEQLLNPAHFCIFLSVIDLLSNLSIFFSFKAIYQVILLNMGFVCLNCGGIKMFMLDSCSHVLKRSI